MPKNCKVVKIGNINHKVKVSNKFRIGTRDDGISAHFMSNEELAEVLTNKNKTRYVPSAMAVLKLRNVSI